jgi:hypothetical protein
MGPIRIALVAVRHQESEQGLVGLVEDQQQHKPSSRVEALGLLPGQTLLNPKQPRLLLKDIASLARQYAPVDEATVLFAVASSAARAGWARKTAWLLTCRTDSGSGVPWHCLLRDRAAKDVLPTGSFWSTWWCVP